MSTRFLLFALAVIGAAPVAAQTSSTKAAGHGEAASGNALIERLPPRGGITSEKTIAAAGLTEWKLANGARVLVKPTDFMPGEVLFTAYSPGGSSLVPDADYVSATLAPNILQLGGLGRFNRGTLDLLLTGKVAKVEATIGSTSEELSGTSSTRDLETLFELIHLSFTEPRLDMPAYRIFKQRIGLSLDHRMATEAFNDSITLMMGQHHFRSRPLSTKVFNEADPTRALTIYKDRFSDAGDFTFVFVGDVKLGDVKALSEMYLANLPATGRKETWKDTEPVAPRGALTRVLRIGTSPNALTQLYFHGPFEYTPENRFVMRAMIDLLQNRLTDVLSRVQLGARAPSVQGGPSRVPRAEYLIRVEYETLPQQADKIGQTVQAVIDSLKTNGPSQADVERVRQQFMNARPRDLKTNAYWLRNIAARDQSGEDVLGLLAPYDEMIKNLTGAQIQKAAQQYFDTRNFGKFTMLPGTAYR